MLWNKTTNSFEPVVTQFEDTMVTGDGVDLNENYTLVWKLDGEEKTFTYKYDGQTLLKSAVRSLNHFVAAGHDGNKVSAIRRELGVIASLWSILKINPKKYKTAIKGYDHPLRAFLNAAKNGNKEKLDMVETFIAAYFYLKLGWREEHEKEYTTYVMNDFMSVPDDINGKLDEGWKDSPIAKELNLKTWDEYQATLSNGIMYGNFVPNMDEVTIH
jgi:hypothetical protein